MPGGTCCLKEHEDAIQQAIEIYGDTYWHCRLTILRFSECGRCAPDADRYINTNGNKRYMNFTMSYIGTTGMPLQANQNNGVRLCQNACRNIYTECISATTILDEPVIPEGVTMKEYCANAPEISTEDVACYSTASNQYDSSAFFTVALILPISLLVTASFIL